MCLASVIGCGLYYGNELWDVPQFLALNMSARQLRHFLLSNVGCGSIGMHVFEIHILPHMAQHAVLVNLCMWGGSMLAYLGGGRWVPHLKLVRVHSRCINMSARTGHDCGAHHCSGVAIRAFTLSGFGHFLF